MKVLVIGRGGAEHAIVWKLSESRHIDKIYCSPGNAGIAEIAECIDVSPNEFDALIDFIKYEWIDLTIVGSEESLSKGIVDAFEKEGCRIIGPNKAAAKLGLSRVFAKELMKLHRIPTAEYKVFTSYLHAEDYVRLKGAPIVIKIDRPVEGDGVFVAFTVEEAIDALRLIMKEKVFGDAGNRVIVEDYLKGEEVSLMILTDGKTVAPLGSSKNYNRLFDGNTGPNTEGMGAYSPAHSITKKLEVVIIEKIMRPALKALNSEGIKYRGVICTDLVIDKDRPSALRFKCCFGDMEAQTVLPRLETDLMEIALAILEERLSDIKLGWKHKASLCVVATSESYTDKYQEGTVITGLEKAKKIKDVFVFHGNTSFNNSEVVTSGKRVVSATAIGSSIKDARAKAYRAVENIHFDGMHYRKDIGGRI